MDDTWQLSISSRTSFSTGDMVDVPVYLVHLPTGTRVDIRTEDPAAFIEGHK